MSNDKVVSQPKNDRTEDQLQNGQNQESSQKGKQKENIFMQRAFDKSKKEADMDPNEGYSIASHWKERTARRKAQRVYSLAYLAYLKTEDYVGWYLSVMSNMGITGENHQSYLNQACENIDACETKEEKLKFIGDEIYDKYDQGYSYCGDSGCLPPDYFLCVEVYKCIETKVLLKKPEAGDEGQDRYFYLTVQEFDKLTKEKMLKNNWVFSSYAFKLIPLALTKSNETEYEIKEDKKSNYSYCVMVNSRKRKTVENIIESPYVLFRFGNFRIVEVANVSNDRIYYNRYIARII